MLLVHAEHKPTPDTQPHSVFDDFDEDIKRGDDRRFFADMLAYMDRLVGKVVDKLDERGLRDNTIVIVMGDNGTKEPFTHVLPDGTEYPGGKGGNRDNGLHVPLVLACPETIPAGQSGAIRSYDGLVDVTDIYPTICEAADIEIPNPAAIDGNSRKAEYHHSLKGLANIPKEHPRELRFDENDRSLKRVRGPSIGVVLNRTAGSWKPITENVTSEGFQYNRRDHDDRRETASKLEGTAQRTADSGAIVPRNGQRRGVGLWKQPFDVSC